MLKLIKLMLFAKFKGANYVYIYIKITKVMKKRTFGSKFETSS